jgi:lipopolysaccharide transport system ATP-binding protein
LIEDGKIVSDGSLEQTIRKYQLSYGNSQVSAWQKRIIGKEPIFFSKIELALTGDQPELKLQINCVIKSQSEHKRAFVAFDVSSSNGTAIFQAIPVTTPFIDHAPGEQTITTEVSLPPLIPDQYKVSAWLGSYNTETFCWEKYAVGFEIDKSPIQGRNIPHSHYNGFLIAKSRLINGQTNY